MVKTLIEKTKSNLDWPRNPFIWVANLLLVPGGATLAYAQFAREDQKLFEEYKNSKKHVYLLSKIKFRNNPISKYILGMNFWAMDALKIDAYSLAITGEHLFNVGIFFK